MAATSHGDGRRRPGPVPEILRLDLPLEQIQHLVRFSLSIFSFVLLRPTSCLDLFVACTGSGLRSPRRMEAALRNSAVEQIWPSVPRRSGSGRLTLSESAAAAFSSRARGSGGGPCARSAAT